MFGLTNVLFFNTSSVSCQGKQIIQTSDDRLQTPDPKRGSGKKGHKEVDKEIWTSGYHVKVDFLYEESDVRGPGSSV